MSYPIIKLTDITKTYLMGQDKKAVKTQALAGVSLAIYPGQLVSIMGHSGSGKSTLMHILGLLDKPTSGTYFLENRQTETLSDDELADLRKLKIGFVFQAFNLLPRTSALENVMLPLLYTQEGSKNIEAKAKKILISVNLGDRLYHKPNELSGGEQQRVAIARALINNPAVILADEPTGNLDSKSSQEIMNILTDLNKAGHTIVLVTHEVDIANYCSRIITLKDGQIITDKLKS